MYSRFLGVVSSCENGEKVMIEIISAVATDAPQIAEFWNPIIRNTHVTFATTEKSINDLVAMIEGRPFFVAKDGDQVLGFATYGQFRGGNGYAYAMEHTIILAPPACGRGVGRALMVAIENHARDAGAHTMIAAVSAENPDGIGFHAKLGYKDVARIPEVGRKFDMWLELVIMQKIL